MHTANPGFIFMFISFIFEIELSQTLNPLVAQAGYLELRILLLQSLEYWDNDGAIPYLASV